MPHLSRSEINARLWSRVKLGKPVVMCGAGVGLVAKVADGAGIDAIMAYNTGPFRMDGFGSLAGYLAYGDANAITIELTRRICKVVKTAPVVAGVGAAAPYRSRDSVVDALLAAGASGITNVPTAGIYDGTFRSHIEATGLGYDEEIALIKTCSERDIFTVAYAFNAKEAAAMAQAGADVVAGHVGLTSGGLIGAKDVLPLDEVCARIVEMAKAVQEARPGTLVLAHGGPLEDPDSVQEVLRRTDVHGYLGASSIERLAVERSVAQIVHELKNLRLGGGAGL